MPSYTNFLQSGQFGLAINSRVLYGSVLLRRIWAAFGMSVSDPIPVLSADLSMVAETVRCFESSP